MLNLPTFLFINGPPHAGKDTLAKLICEAVPGAYIESFAEPIRAMIYNVFFPNEGPIEYSFDLRDGAVKYRDMPFQEHDEAIHEGHPITIREEMIAFSDGYMKRRYGDTIFGKLLWHRAQEQMLFSSHFVISDSGFVPEAAYLISQVGAEHCTLIKLSRKGCDYSGDSRSYITLPGVRTIDLTNDGAPEDMLTELSLHLGNL